MNQKLSHSQQLLYIVIFHAHCSVLEVHVALVNNLLYCAVVVLNSACSGVCYLLSSCNEFVIQNLFEDTATIELVYIFTSHSHHIVCVLGLQSARI